MRVLVSGATGLIGTALCRALEARGDAVVALTRREGGIRWAPSDGRIDGSVDGFDAVVHLAGAGIGDHRWSEGYKAEIRDSRVNGTRALAEALAACTNKPSVFVSGSAVGYYGNRGREELIDEQSAPGGDFLAQVCIDWEAAAQPAIDAGIRTAFARTGVVLSPTGGVLSRMVIPFKLGVGGKISRGNQYMSWVTLADEVRALLHIIDGTLAGPVNLTGPHPCTNETFTRMLGEVLHRPTFVPIPLFAMRALMGSEMVDALLVHGQRVFPKALEADGFEFTSQTVEEALRSVLAK
jgi:uncharacterized protein (TIGR01777 family)